MLLDLCQHAKVKKMKLLAGFICTQQAASDTKNCARPLRRMLLILCSWNVKPLQIAHSTVVIVQIRVCKKNPAHRTFLCQRKVRRFGRTQPDHRFDCLIHCVAELHGDCPSLVQALYSDRKKWHCHFANGFGFFQGPKNEAPRWLMVAAGILASSSIKAWYKFSHFMPGHEIWESQILALHGTIWDSSTIQWFAFGWFLELLGIAF